MDQNENTKSGPEQVQSPGLQESASQAEEPGNMKAESPRKCRICGGPNHYGCGCEAKAAQESIATEAGDKASFPDEQPAAETQTPAAEMDKAMKVLEDILSPAAIIESHKSNLQMATDIKTMADGFEGLCACFYDTNQLLKIIAGDCITIRKFLTKEDEVKNADPDKPEKNKN